MNLADKIYLPKILKNFSKLIPTLQGGTTFRYFSQNTINRLELHLRLHIAPYEYPRPLSFAKTGAAAYIPLATPSNRNRMTSSPIPSQGERPAPNDRPRVPPLPPSPPPLPPQQPDPSTAEHESLLPDIPITNAPRQRLSLLDEPATPPYLILLFVLVPAAIGLICFSTYSRAQAKLVREKEHIVNVVAPTVLISIDGFRHDYLHRVKKGSGGRKLLAPTLNKLAANGVRAHPGMQPVMPTTTFPNHWSLVTGLYAGTHNIVGSIMYSPITRSWFHHSGNDPHWWTGEPIWQTLQRTARHTRSPNGTDLPAVSNYTTGCVFWPGCEVPRHAPDAFWKYDDHVSYTRRVDRVMHLLAGTSTDLDRAAQFVALYFEGVDRAGHEFGPNSDQVDHAIALVDSAIARLVSKVRSEVSDNVNFIVVSDHGMSAVSNDHVIDFSSVIPEGTVQDIGSFVMGMWLNVTTPSEKVFQEIQSAIKKRNETQVALYRKQEMPERWHLSNSLFIPPVVTLVTLGWMVTYPHQNLIPGSPISPSKGSKVEISGGSHGYDNLEDEMQALFIASGPAFRSNGIVEGFRSIDLYPLLCSMFSAQPAPNNGSLDISLNHILRAP